MSLLASCAISLAQTNTFNSNSPSDKMLNETEVKAENGDVNAMVAMGNSFSEKWWYECSAFYDTNSNPIDPKTGFPTRTISPTNSVSYCKSMEWYEKAAALGSTNAMWKIIEKDESADLAGDYFCPNTGLPMTKEALRWLRKLAKKGDSSAIKTVRDFDSQINQALISSNRPDLEVLDVRAKVTQTNNTSWQWSYQLKVKNNTLKPLEEYHAMLFLDAEGFIIEKSPREVKLSAGETRTILDTTLVNLPGAALVKKIKCE